MKPLNYFGLQVPKEFGGAALDSISAAIVVEEISRVCAAIGLCVTVHNGVAVYPFLQFATPEQKKHYLPKLASGEIIGAFSLTEANAGSDAASVETTAVKKNQEYILNGTKIFVTNGGVCDLALIFALTGSDPGTTAEQCFYCRKQICRIFARRTGRSLRHARQSGFLTVSGRLLCAGKKSAG